MARREEKPCGRELTEDEGSVHRRDLPHWQENGNQWRHFISMLLCLMLILLPFPFLSVPSPFFPGTSHFILALLSSWFLFSFQLPCLRYLMFLTVEKPIFLSKLRMEAVSLLELPRCSPKPASTAPKGLPFLAQNCLALAEGLPEKLPLRHWGGMGCLRVLLTVSHHTSSFTGVLGSSLWGAPVSWDFQMLEQNCGSCHWNESWWRCSDGPWT